MPDIKMHICCVYVVDNKIEFDGFVKRGLVPTGLSYISGALKQAGYTTEGLCYRIDQKSACDCLLDGLEKQPDVFAVSVNTVFSYGRIQELLTSIKSRFKDAKIIAGGFYARISPESIIFDKNIDAVCVGEGESTVAQCVRMIEQGIYEKTDNFWIKKPDGSILKCDRNVFVGDIDSVPMDRDIWNKYLDKTRPNQYYLIVQRGCPYRCLYCANGAISEKSEGRYLRYRNIDSVIKELEDIRIKFPYVDTVEFNADNIFSDMDYFFRLFEKLKKLNGTGKNRFKFKITGNCTVGFIEKYGDIAKYLKEANVTKVLFSMESGSGEIRAKLKRPFYRNEDIINLCRMLKKEKIQTHVSLMYCYPFETDETYRDSVRCIKLADPDFVKMTFLKALPNTEFELYLKEKNLPLITFKDAVRYIAMAVKFKIKLSRIIEYIVDLKNDFSADRVIGRNKKYRELVKKYFDRGDFKNAVKALNKLAETDSSPWIYGDLAIAKMNIKDYKGALESFAVAVSGGQKDVYLQKMEECRAKMKEEKQNENLL